MKNKVINFKKFFFDLKQKWNSLSKYEKIILIILEIIKINLFFLFLFSFIFENFDEIFKQPKFLFPFFFVLIEIIFFVIVYFLIFAAKTTKKKGE